MSQAPDSPLLYSRARDHRTRPADGSRRVIPSGEVSPDGRRVWPRTTMTSKVLVYGGIGLAAAALTAGGVLAVRTVVDSIAGDEEDDARDAARRRAKAMLRPSSPATAFGPSAAPRRHAAPQHYRPEDGHLEAERQAAPRPRPVPRRPAPQPASLVDSVNDSVQSLSQGLRDILDVANTAIASFRGVATQAGGIMREFHSAADQVRAFLEPDSAAKRASGRPKPVDLRGGADDPRPHRL